MCSVKSHVRSAVFRPWHKPTIVFLLVYCPVDNTFEVSPEIRCSGVSSHYCCYGDHAAGSKPIKKTLSYQLRIEGLSVPKIISNCCELVKLYDINGSGPVFWDRVYHPFSYLCSYLLTCLKSNLISPQILNILLVIKSNLVVPNLSYLHIADFFCKNINRHLSHKRFHCLHHVFSRSNSHF